MRSVSTIAKKMEEVVSQANFSLRKDVLSALSKALKKEKRAKPKKALQWLLENAHKAKKERIALCQDTGLPVVFIEMGPRESLSASFVREVMQGIEKAYAQCYLRPSAVDALKRGRPSYKGGDFHVDISPKRKGIKITVLPKGFGSENKSQLKMFNPTAEWSDIEHFIIEAVKSAGPGGCPPFIVGVGIGGTSDRALLLAKKALLEKIDRPHPDRSVERLQKQLLKKINALQIGPMGLGGNCTALAVKIKTAPTHIAGLPVGVNINCHALRSATIIL